MKNFISSLLSSQEQKHKKEMEELIESIPERAGYPPFPSPEQRLIINGKYFGVKVDFNNDVLKEKIDNLGEKDKEKLLEKVVTVCEHWNTLKVAPNNCLGTIARYQTALLFLTPKSTRG